MTGRTIVAIYDRLDPIGQRILSNIAERLLLGIDRHGPWTNDRIRPAEKREEIEDALIYVAKEMIELEDEEHGTESRIDLDSTEQVAARHQSER